MKDFPYDVNRRKGTYFDRNRKQIDKEAMKGHYCVAYEGSDVRLSTWARKQSKGLTNIATFFEGSTVIDGVPPRKLRPKPLRIKIDPGAKFTGLALVSDTKIVWAAELEHRGFTIREALTSIRQQRLRRRNRKTRYRKPRFLNRRRQEGWLPPSLMSRVLNIQTWVNRLCKLAPVSAISQELVRFDTQKMMNPEITGTEYQRGELLGYEVRQYLLEKFKRTCVYCHATDKPFNLDDFHPKSRGGSDRVSNLVLSCVGCNEAKGNKLPAEFLSDRPDLLLKLDKQRKQPLAALLPSM